MSVRIMAAVFESNTLKSGERLVMLALADHADDQGRCYPSTPRLAQRTGMSERAVQGHIKALRAEGYLQIEDNAGPGGTNLFFVRPTPATPAKAAPPQKLRPRKSCATPPQKTSFTPAESADEPSRTTNEPSEEPLVVPRPKKPKRRASSISEDWEPSERNVEDAFKKQFTAQEIRDEAQRFRDYHLAKGTTFADWDAGWRTWIGNARKFGSSRSAGRQQSSAGQQLSGLAGAAMRRRDARQQGYEG